MRVKAGFLIIISLLLLVGLVAADLPDTSTISSGTDWVVANRIDQASITVYALNATDGAQKHALVLFDVDNPEYGSISPKSVLSDNSGKAKSTFKVNQTSGVVNISARISADGFTVIRYITST